MLCFEIWLNGKKLSVIGHKDAISLVADVTFHYKHNSQFLGLNAITFSEEEKTKDCVWEAPQVGRGDEVLIRLVESDTPQQPDHELPFALRMPMPWTGERNQCSFCGAEAIEGLAFFEGFDARICDKCIEFRHGIINDEHNK